MNGTLSFQRFAAIIAIASFFTAITSDVLQGIPVNFNSEFPINPVSFLSVGAEGAKLLRWGLILDMLGYYLPLLPIALLIQHWFKAKHPIWVHFYTTCGLGYILIGATGAIALAVVQPPLINAYAQAATAQRAILQTIFEAIWNIVYGGMWNILGELLVSIWWRWLASAKRAACTLYRRYDCRYCGACRFFRKYLRDGRSCIRGTFYLSHPCANLGVVVWH